MFLRNKYEFLRAPDDETGSAQVDEQVVDQGTDTGADDQPQSLRQQLERNFEAEKQATAKADKSQEKGSGKGRYTSRARQEAEEVDETAGAEGTEQQQQEQPTTQPPEAFSKEAKAEWAKVPPTVQNAILKREQDSARGVQEIKEKYAEIDRAIAPHMEAIRRTGRTPAETVNQLFSWFQALAGNPREAFPALARSFNLDIRQFVPQEQQQQQQEAGAEQPPGEVTPAVQQYINKLEQQIGQMGQYFQQQIGDVQQTFASQSQAKTQEILDNWSRDKKYFGEPGLREHMAQLIQAGAVPLKNGQVDLDAVYDRAIWGFPEVRTKVISDQEAERQAKARAAQEAERKAQADQAAKARKAAISTVGGAPGAPAGQGKAPKGKGKSVRESIMEARELLSS